MDDRPLSAVYRPSSMVKEMSMSKEQALVPVEEKRVVFYEDEIAAVLVETAAERQIFIPIKPICDQLGVTWPSQLNRIRRDPVLSRKIKGVFITNTPGGRQEMSCLPLDYLNGWLFGINAARVNEDVRDRLIRYQDECYKALAEAFREGRLMSDPTFDELLTSESDAVQAYKMALAVVKLARNQILLEGRLDSHGKEIAAHTERLEQLEAKLAPADHAVTNEQASQISQAVKTVAIALGKKSGKNEFGGVYGEFYRRFGITSYKMLPAHQFEKAMRFLTDWHQNLVGEGPF
jgi:hypothetical protein